MPFYAFLCLMTYLSLTLHKKLLKPPKKRCIFQILLKFIKLVISKILFILILCSFNFYFRITKPPQRNNPHTTKIKISDLPPAKTFWRGRVHTLKAQLKLSPSIQKRVQQNYLPESYARYLPSYQKCHKIGAPTK